MVTKEIKFRQHSIEFVRLSIPLNLIIPVFRFIHSVLFFWNRSLSVNFSGQFFGTSKFTFQFNINIYIYECCVFYPLCLNIKWTHLFCQCFCLQLSYIYSHLACISRLLSCFRGTSMRLSMTEKYIQACMFLCRFVQFIFDGYLNWCMNFWCHTHKHTHTHRSIVSRGCGCVSLLMPYMCAQAHINLFCLWF